MSTKRKGNAPVEATQELQALDVLEIVETLKNAPRAASGATPKASPGPAVTRKPLGSNSSIAPVGLDLAPRHGAADEEVNPTMEIRLPARPRRRLGAIVIATIAGCALILVAAGIARVGHASSAPDTPLSAASAAATTAATPIATSTATTDTVSSPATTSTPAAAPATTAPRTTDPSSSTGTVRLDRPAIPGHVWLDGQKLQSKSVLVSCGTHQLRVGHGRTHSIDVPCGSEIGVSK
jgi:hypothetical protein